MPRSLYIFANSDAEYPNEAMFEIFGVEIDDDTVTRWRTAGDILRSIEERLGGFERAGTPAVTKAFYLLRQILRDNSVRPDTPVANLKGAGHAGTFLHRLGRRAKLVVPTAPTTRLSGWAALIMVAGLLTLAVFAFVKSGHASCGPSDNNWLAVGVLLSGTFGIPCALWYVDYRRFPNELRTAGDLARAVAYLNVKRFWEMGAARRRVDLWPALRYWLSIVSDVPEAEIDLDSPLDTGAFAP